MECRTGRNITLEEIEVMDDGSNEYPWEHSPITMHLCGWRAPYSYAPYPQKTLEPYVENGYAYVSEEMPLSLKPYGCTALRISCFPRANLKQQVNATKVKYDAGDDHTAEL